VKLATIRPRNGGARRQRQQHLDPVLEPPVAAPPTSLSHDDAVADARELVGLLESSHPDCYAPFGGRVAFQREAQRLVAAMPAQGLETEDLAARLRLFMSRLGDGHSTFAGA
jgi:hypothetical protein